MNTYSATFNSCTKCVYSPSMMHNRTPDGQSVSWAWIYRRPHNWPYLRFASYVGHWCAWSILWHVIHGCLYKPGTGRRLVDKFSNEMFILYPLCILAVGLMFRGMEWGTERVFDQQVAVAEQLGVHPVVLDTLQDVVRCFVWKKTRVYQCTFPVYVAKPTSFCQE